MCEPCNGKGWLLCDFCKGQKINVRAENNRIYRRCPSCRATGYILCSNCKVFKCVTFPNSTDGADLSF
ncbi:protein PHOTOSYSTEM I ASSEMBLY 2, chloroplastic [Alnus glutinosa]|uniref:protein PHOTOSYSTEM I ASSEMBLY 2, chloroplastic n=1 Tax=Alnus glutinosa TaxID=3517 RepID=UPI002D7924B1|nr:protein PHOTOSYSTEM I ASSEMBLY 2, chloroplastic [Alnus glutinosa]